jgi:hypothetical protein
MTRGNRFAGSAPKKYGKSYKTGGGPAKSRAGAGLSRRTGGRVFRVNTTSSKPTTNNI